MTLFQSFVWKFSLFGAFFNRDKKFLIKELTLLAIVGAALLNINKLELWPLAIAVTFSLTAAFIFECLLKVDWPCFLSPSTAEKCNNKKGVKNKSKKNKHQIHSIL